MQSDVGNLGAEGSHPLVLHFTCEFLLLFVWLSRQISKKHQIRLDTPWLDPTKTLPEQEVTETDELILMYRFYYHLQLQR